MNTISSDAHRKFSEVLAAMPTMAQARNGKKSETPENTATKPGGRSDDLLAWQLSVNATYWSMLAAKSATAEGTGGEQPAATGSSSSTQAAEAAQRMRLVSIYGAAATGTIAGWSAVRVVPAGSELSLAA